MCVGGGGGLCKSCERVTVGRLCARVIISFMYRLDIAHYI